MDNYLQPRHIVWKLSDPGSDFQMESCKGVRQIYYIQCKKNRSERPMDCRGKKRELDDGNISHGLSYCPHSPFPDITFIIQLKGESTTQAQKINKALIERVVPALIEDGFVGKFPDYKKVCENHIKFLFFDKDKYGNTFYVATSIISPHEPPKHTNIAYHRMALDEKVVFPIDEISIKHCNKYFFMKGTLENMILSKQLIQSSI